MKIGIVILNWNGVVLLQRYLPSVVKYSVAHTIYLADNASTDTSVSWVREHFPQVNIILMDENRGYAGGYNEAIKNIDEEYLCLLNNDIEVTQGWLEPFVKLFNSDLNVGAAQPLIIDDNKRNYFEYAGAAGGYLDRFAYPYCRGRIFNEIENNNNQYQDTNELDWASGAAFFINKQAFFNVGSFDENYFAHQEEIDVCWRLKHAGFRIGVVTSSIVYHLGGGTLESLNPKKTYLNFRNSLFNIVKNDHSSVWFLILFSRMILDGIAAFQYLFLGKLSYFMAILKAHGAFYIKLFSMLKARQKIKSFSKIDKSERKVQSIVYQYFIKKRRVFKDLP